MKLYISVDMEGLAGITNWKDETEDRERFRNAMNEQVEWVLEGISKSKHNKEITHIYIADSHGGGQNLSYDRLNDKDERVWLVSGSPRPQYMMPAMDDSFDMVFLVGYHAGAGEADSSMDHTYSGASVQNIYINGQLMNEGTINSAYAGIVHKVPVGLIIGDSGLERQMKGEGMMPWPEFVCTKQSLSRFSAVYKPKKLLKEETIAAVKKALDENERPQLYTLQAPYHCRMDLTNAAKCDQVQQMPGIHRTAGRTVEFESTSFTEIYDAIHGIATMSRLG
ncbi:MAG: M55 family metallopeptidase [Negativibacillus sp.]|nr:M55 family metallopeptidase [Negativibacillus sp.]